MRETLQAGLSHEFSFVVPPTKTVPHLYPESSEFQAMPQVFATGFLVGLIEWTCIQVLEMHLDWPRELSVGTHVALSRCSHERFVIDAAKFNARVAEKAARKS